MELGMHCRDSGGSVKLHALHESERTICACLLIRNVAFPSIVRQQLLKLSDKPCKNIAGLGRCYRLLCANLDPTEESRHIFF